MLHDLEELVLKCRDDRAKAYIGEAVGCYRAGSYRAAIVATWIAVAFDIIDKIRELSLAGDKEADRLAKEFESIRKSHDVLRSLAFERSLLSVARDKLELISPMEYQDLERIQEDRHRCAHPSHTSDAETFAPSSELARLHIRSAVETLLMHEPSQGRAALDGLLREIDSPYFPTKRDEALKALEKGVLKRARRSLIRNASIVIVKTMLDPTVEAKKFLRYQSALVGISALHLEEWRRTLAADFGRLVRPLSKATELRRVVQVVMADEELWEFLDDSLQVRVRTFVENLPTEPGYVSQLEYILTYKPLAAAAKIRASRMTMEEFKSSFFFTMPGPVADRLIHQYAISSSFEEANSWAKIIQGSIPDLSKEQAKWIISASGKNSQILGSYQLEATLHILRKDGPLSEKEFSAALTEFGLDDYQE